MSKKEKDLINELVDFALNYNVDYIYVLEEIKNILNGKVRKINLNDYLD
jgi:hypothetical protein